MDDASTLLTYPTGDGRADRPRGLLPHGRHHGAARRAGAGVGRPPQLRHQAEPGRIRLRLAPRGALRGPPRRAAGRQAGRQTPQTERPLSADHTAPHPPKSIHHPVPRPPRSISTATPASPTSSASSSPPPRSSRPHTPRSAAAAQPIPATPTTTTTMTTRSPSGSRSRCARRWTTARKKRASRPTRCRGTLSSTQRASRATTTS